MCSRIIYLIKGDSKMDKNKKVVVIIICAFMMVNTWTTLSMKEQIKNLENEIGTMHSRFSNEIINTGQDINNLRNDLVSKIEKGESLLSSYETEAEYKNQQIVYTVKVVPKEKRIDEIIFLSLGDEKKEAISTNGSDYTASFVITMPQKIIPIISFESPTGVRQEVLSETNLHELFSLGFESSWENQNSSSEKDKAMLALTIYAQDERSHSLLSETPTATIVIKDISTDTEIGRMEMQSTEVNPMFNKELNAISFNADLSDYSKKEGSYNVWIEIKTNGDIFYCEQIATFNYDGKYSSGLGSSSGILYPVW